MGDWLDTTTVGNAILILISLALATALVVKGIRASGYNISLPRRARTAKPTAAGQSRNTPSSSPASATSWGGWKGFERKPSLTFVVLAVVVAFGLIAWVIPRSRDWYQWRTAGNGDVSTKSASRSAGSRPATPVEPLLVSRSARMPSAASQEYSPCFREEPGYDQCINVPAGEFRTRACRGGVQYQSTGEARDLTVYWYPDGRCPGT